MNKSKIIQMVVLLAVIVVVAGGLLRTLQHNSLSLSDYERLNVSEASSETAVPPETEASVSQEQEDMTETLQGSEDSVVASKLTGAVLNSASLKERVTYSEGFYYEPVSDSLRRYITGVSYPTEDMADKPEITVEELRYVHIWHYDFDGNPTEGELICNEYIAQDLVQIFYELYRNEYQLEKVLLIDEYDGDDNASMEDNNTSCFNYRTVSGKTSLSKHAYGLAVDINPLYNPYVTYNEDGTGNVAPAAAENYADRSADFAYKIDETDFCYKLFTEHGFTWGGNWNSSKDYQHFQKTKP